MRPAHSRTYWRWCAVRLGEKPAGPASRPGTVAASSVSYESPRRLFLRELHRVELCSTHMKYDLNDPARERGDIRPSLDPLHRSIQEIAVNVNALIDGKTGNRISLLVQKADLGVAGGAGIYIQAEPV